MASLLLHSSYECPSPSDMRHRFAVGVIGIFAMRESVRKPSWHQKVSRHDCRLHPTKVHVSFLVGMVA